MENRRIRDDGHRDALQCDICAGASAALVCPCAFPAVCLCFECFEKHEEAGQQHASFPIALRPLIVKKQDYEQMQARLASAVALKQWIRRSLTSLESSEEALNSAIALAHSAFSNWESNLRTVFARLQSATLDYLRDLEAELDKSITASSSMQLSGIEQVKTDSLSSLMLVSVGELELSGFFDSFVKVRRCILPELSLQHSLPSVQDCVPIVRPKVVKLLTVPSLKSVNVSVLNGVIDVDNNSCWCFIDCDSIFVCGGKSAGKRTTLVSISKHFRSKLADMSVERFLHCLFHANGEVFVFGGAGKDEQTAEKYNSRAGCWSPLTGMKCPRVGASVSLHSCTAFLYGGTRTACIEEFSLESSTFTKLPTSLPYQAWCIALPTTHEVYLFVKDRCVLFNTTTQCLTRFDLIPLDNWWSPTPPLLHDGEFFFLQSTAVHRYTVSTHSYSLIS